MIDTKQQKELERQKKMRKAFICVSAENMRFFRADELLRIGHIDLDLFTNAGVELKDLELLQSELTRVNNMARDIHLKVANYYQSKAN